VVTASDRRGTYWANTLAKDARGQRSQRLRAVDGLGECAIEEGILDIELVHGPTPGDRQSQHSPDGGTLDDGAEGLIVVHPGVLSEALEDSMSLVSIKRAIRLELVLENPLASDDIGPGGRGTKPNMLLDSRATYSTSTVRCQWGFMSALQIEVGIRDCVGEVAVAESCRQPMGLVILAARRVTIGCVLRRSRAMAACETPTSRNDGVNQDHIEGFSVKREFTSTCIRAIIIVFWI
jgi:hypothetical protein